MGRFDIALVNRSRGSVFLAGLVGLLAGTAAWWSWVQVVLGLMYLACFYFSWRWEHHKINGST